MRAPLATLRAAGTRSPIAPRAAFAPRVALAVLALFAALGALALAGCSKPSTPRNANQPPVTRLFLDGPLDTLNYHFRMHWSGDDPDGDVAGFELQLAPNHDAPVDGAWTFTTSVDSILAPPIGDGAGAYTLYVRAVDRQGLKDATPASLYLVLVNHRPSVEFFNLPRRAKGGTYHFLPVLSLQWHVDDPEGASTVRRYHLWLNGGTFDTTLAAKDSSFTLRFDHFGDISQSRARTVYVAGIDEASAVSDTIQYSWMVDAYTVAPGKRVLLVDDYNVDPRFTDNNTPMDDFYRAAASTFSGGTYTLLDVFEVEGIRYAQDATEVLRHFDVVLWYNEGGGASPVQTSLNTARDPLAHYLDQGGHMYLSSLSVVGQDALLDTTFYKKYLGVKSNYCAIPGSCNYTIRGSNTFYSGNPAAPNDSIAYTSGFGRDVDLFTPSDSTITEFYLTAASVGDELDSLPHVGVVTKLLRSGGRVTFSSVPMYNMNRYGNAATVVERLLEGLLSPARPSRFSFQAPFGRR